MKRSSASRGVNIAGCLLLLLVPGRAPAEEAISRTVLALVDGGVEPEVRFSLIHSRAELPLNYLGLVVRYHDIRRGLPPLEELDGVRGVLTWFHSAHGIPARTYVNWTTSLVAAGKKLVVFGEPGPVECGSAQASPVCERFWAALGLRPLGGWINVTYDLEFIHKEPLLIEFERPLSGPLPGYPILAADSGAWSFLKVRRSGDPGTASDIGAIGPGGGYVAAGYLVYAPAPKKAQWFLNPFEFFRRAFGTDDLPKPDVTTASGRRLFYSHIDGDGWRNLTEVPGHRRRRKNAAAVLMEEVMEKFSDLPVTVAPVAADLDPDWHGSEKALSLAREIFSLPHVDAGSHTYSHPLDWDHFAPGSDGGAAGRSLTENLQFRLRTLWDWLSDWLGMTRVYAEVSQKETGYRRPRSYTLKPFRLDREIGGSVALIESVLPPGKTVGVLQWSGDTSPFVEAIAEVRRLGLRNINGGDSRFDPEFPSYIWVSPIGISLGGERQIYASNSNENTYTDLWTDRYFGFKYLLRTIRNTESPRRVKPFNVYYHMYSGEKLPSLKAVQENLRAAREEELAPVSTARYAAIAEGFYQTRLVRLGESTWRIEGRGGLETLRFDRAPFKAVDFARSRGIVGQRHYQGSLYVALDAAVEAPIVRLTDHATSDGLPEAARPYLVEGRWLVSRFQLQDRGFKFRAQGYGAGVMSWKVPAPGTYSVEIRREGVMKSRLRAHAGVDGVLQLVSQEPAVTPLDISVSRLSS